MAAKNPFAAKLAELLLTDPGSRSPSTVDAELKEAFLQTGSETPDNLSCIDYIEYGEISDERWSVKTTYALKLKRQGALLSDIANVLENCDMPREIKERFPNITGEEWDAAMRMMTVIMMAFERDVAAES
ncbi:MAG TPA: hypothetical protein VEJ63_00830 [Planctomycetota bacterium]|nr:hypothetical protein [Planctomycetota bacterium]